MANSKNIMVTEYVKLLGWSTLFLMALTLIAGVAASVRYGANAQGVEGIWHRELSQRWTIALLWIPFTIQLLVLILLSARVWRHKSDQTIRHYFKFYFVRTFISTFAYVALWLSYTFVMQYPSDREMVGILRSVSLILIVLLMYFVVQATYLITRSSFRNSKRLFTPRDIEDRYTCICEKLGAVSEGARLATTTQPPTDSTNQPATTGTPPEVELEPGLRKIHQWLLKDRDYKIHRVAYKGTMADLDTPHLAEALNRLVCSRLFYNDWSKKSDGNDLPPSSFESSNRNYIEGVLAKVCDRTGENSNRDRGGKDRIWGSIGSLWGGDSRSDKQMAQREGIALFPFYTMVFFFSLFLCVAYLFGFAFAFEDRSIQLDSQKPSLGLLMPDDLLEDLGRYSAPVPPPTPLVYQLNDRQKFFYFKKGGAGVTTRTNANDADGRMKRIAHINEGSLTSLVEQIKKALPRGGLRVLLVGRADDSSVNGVTYSSNYEIAAARINSVRYLLQEKLIEDRVSPMDLAAIEWTASPFSNDGSLVPKEKQDPERSKIALVLDNEIGSAGPLGAKVPREFVARLDEDLTFKYGDRTWANDYRSLLGRLKDEVLKNTVTLEGMRQINDDITRWASYKERVDAQRAEGLKNGIDADLYQHKADRLEDDIDAELYQIEDPAGRKRAVEVYLYDTLPAKQESGNTQNLQPNAKRMALIDYLYFAVTTGNNDVKPITAFSKFLCTFANLTQFFFIVVFFNTLLSLNKTPDRG
jgi:hypothetical protein